MAGNIAKPVPQPAASGCGVFNVPVFAANDHAGSAVTLPIPDSTTVRLVVWPSAYRFHIVSAGGSTTLTIMKAGVAQGGTIVAPDGVQVTFDVGGMNDPADIYPDEIRVATDGSAVANIWWDCVNPGGA